MRRSSARASCRRPLPNHHAPHRWPHGPGYGRVKTIDPPKTLVFTWGWEGDPLQQSLITLTFRPKGQQTELTLRQEGLGSAAHRDATWAAGTARSTSSPRT